MTDSNVFILFVVFASILISMTFHEAMHAFTGHWLGDDTAQLEGRLTLNPLKHIDPFLTLLLPLGLVLINLIGGAGGLHAPILGAAKPVPFNPNRVRYEEFGAALVGIAGPLTNLALAVVGALVIRMTHMAVPDVITMTLLIFVRVNIGFFIFNMIPIPPLDGSRLLYAVAPEPIQEVMAQIERAGVMFVLVLLIFLMQFIGPVISSLNDAVLHILL